MPSPSAAIAATRFGLGARKDDLKEIGTHGVDWLRAQLKEGSPPLDDPALSPSHELVAAFFEQIRQRRKDRRTQPVERRSRPMMDALHATYEKEINARTARAVSTHAPLPERLVYFWSNHFTVSATKPQVAIAAGAFEREAIRPHVTGRFIDMALAVLKHPAMLLYLDNAQSTGPKSRAGKRRDRGLNENLAREVLELHTMGAGSGYTQDDVIAFAKALTGWTLAAHHASEGRKGAFFFDDRRHEPGVRRVLSKTYDADGMHQAENILRDVARTPATAMHIANKFARHFVADEPPAALVERLAATFRKTGGDLRALAATLIASPEAWQTPLAKIKTPQDLIFSTLRGLGAKPWLNRRILGSFKLLGQLPFFAPSPAGWPDDAAAWTGPDAIAKRLEWISALAAHIPGARDPRDLAERLLGGTLSGETRQAVARASSPAQGFVLLFMSPEFQRR